MDTPFMERAAISLCAAGLKVYRYEFAYMAARRTTGKKAPPSRFERLQEELREMWGTWDAPGPRFLGGKSLGSRVSVSLAGPLGAAGVVALGYPFHPPGKPESLRLAPFQSLNCPCLIFQGTRDPFGRPDEVQGYELGPHTQIHWIEGGTHDLAVRRSDPEPFAEIAQSLKTWVTQKAFLSR